MIFLIGMPASGKSYWGKKIALELNLPLADLDELVIQQEGRSIADIFSQKGAEYFRDIEKSMLQQVTESYPENTLVACGGGTPAYHNNMDNMKGKGCVVFLDTPLDLLYDRLKDDATRPLIPKKENTQKRLQELFEERKEIYQQADYILKPEELSLTTFAKIIEKCTNRH